MAEWLEKAERLWYTVKNRCIMRFISLVCMDETALHKERELVICTDENRKVG